MKRPVIIDTDPGIDDALAILMALRSPALEVRGITTVAGNVGIGNVTRNALSLAGLAGFSIPVAAGAVRPLVAAPRVAAHVHGENGTGDVVLPPPRAGLDPRPAIDLIRDLAMAEEGGLDLICLGPLTNVALALAVHPGLARGPIRHIFMMGGSATEGNATPAAEFNIVADPHAAEAVFRSGIPITMCGLDVTNRALVSQADIDALRAEGGFVAGLCSDMLEYYLGVYHGFGFVDLALHDAVAVAAAIEPGIVDTLPLHVEVETDGEHCTGRTVVDLLGVSGLEPNADVAFTLDHPRFLAMARELILAYD